MARCELLEKCVFFNEHIKGKSASIEKFRERFCDGEHSKCARHMVYNALGKDKVPLDMYPDQVARAQAMINLRGLI